MTETKFFVVSLPRTGTTTLCEMAKICGLNPKHIPHQSYYSLIKGNEFNFFSDTPIFCPKIVEEICSFEDINAKFIFIERDFKEVFDSWKRVGLHRYYLIGSKAKDDLILFDRSSYNDAFGGVELTEENSNDVFQNHKNLIFDIINKNNKEVLSYNFKEGWKPFCDFLNVQVPNQELPHFNKGVIIKYPQKNS